MRLTFLLKKKSKQKKTKNKISQINHKKEESPTTATMQEAFGDIQRDSFDKIIP